MINNLFHDWKQQAQWKSRTFGLVMCLVILALVYLFQRFNYAQFFYSWFGDANSLHPNTIFIVNKSIRLVINDTTSLFMIYFLFQRKSYVKIGSIIQMAEMFIILPLYFYIKLTLEGDSEISSPLLSQFHRLIVNPTLMMLLIIGFFYQKKQLQKS